MTRPRRAAALAPLLALVAALGPLTGLAACSSTPKEPEPTWVDAEVVAGSDRQLWKIVLLALQRQRFPESSAMDPTAMRAETGWRLDLSPFKGRGFRERAIVQCTPIGPGRWRVDVRVQKQTNETLARTLDPSYAEWEWADDDVVAARVLLQHVRALLDPRIEPTEEEEVDPLERAVERARRERQGQR